MTSAIPFSHLSVHIFCIFSLAYVLEGREWMLKKRRQNHRLNVTCAI